MGVFPLFFSVLARNRYYFSTVIQGFFFKGIKWKHLRWGLGGDSVVKPLAVQGWDLSSDPHHPCRVRHGGLCVGSVQGPVTLANQGGTVSKAKEQNIEGNTWHRPLACICTCTHVPSHIYTYTPDTKGPSSQEAETLEWIKLVYIVGYSCWLTNVDPWGLREDFMVLLCIGPAPPDISSYSCLDW